MKDRLPIPDRSDYSSYTTKRGGVWLLINGNGKVLYDFSGVEEKELYAQKMINVLFNLYHQKRIEFEIHRINNPDLYAPTYEEANFTHKAVIKGFEPSAKPFNPYENWFGVSRSCYAGQHNSIILRRESDNKYIKLAFQFIFVWPDEPIEIASSEVFRTGQGKYIGFFHNDEPVYQDWFGKIPEMNFIEDFIK